MEGGSEEGRTVQAPITALATWPRLGLEALAPAHFLPTRYYYCIYYIITAGSGLLSRGTEGQEMQPTHTCCAFKNSERPAFLGQASPGQKALSLHPLAKTHSSSQHVPSTVQRKQERLWSPWKALSPSCVHPHSRCPSDPLT